jgi:hypothetical protein
LYFIYCCYVFRCKVSQINKFNQPDKEDITTLSIERNGQTNTIRLNIDGPVGDWNEYASFYEMRFMHADDILFFVFPLNEPTFFGYLQQYNIACFLRMKTKIMKMKASERTMREQYLADGNVAVFLVGVGPDLRDDNYNNNTNNDDDNVQMVSKKECKALARKIDGTFVEVRGDSVEDVDALFEKALSMVEKVREKRQSNGGLFNKFGKLLKRAS